LHGFSDAADGWLSAGKANFILDSLIDSGKAKPMVVVMTLGYGNMPCCALAGPRPQRGECRPLPEGAAPEVMPQVEAAYHVSKKSEDRAITGLPMGGQESLLIGLGHTNLFAWIGTFSAGINAQTVSQLPVLTPASANLRLLWMACVSTTRCSIRTVRHAALRHRNMPVPPSRPRSPPMARLAG